MKRRTRRRLLGLGRSAVSVVGELLERRRAASHRHDARAAGDGRPRRPPAGGTDIHPLREVVATGTGRPQIAYAPVRDGDADPGEIVWTWVPYEEDASRGKDRPVVVIGHLADDVAALQLTSRQRDDQHHLALGIGDWDPAHRPSWVRLDRVLRLDPDGIRREGATLDRARFERVIAAFEAYGG